MARANHPVELVGTWQCSAEYGTSGELLPLTAKAPDVYLFAADGSGRFMPDGFPGVPAGLPMRWGVIDGRLRIGGARTGRSTHRFEFPDANTLVLYDRYGARSVFVRLPDGGS